MSAPKATVTTLCFICGIPAEVGCGRGHGLCSACHRAYAWGAERSREVSVRSALDPITRDKVMCPDPGCKEDIGALPAGLGAAHAPAVAPQEVKLTPLKPEMPEYKLILQRFGATMSAELVTGIYKIDNPPLKGIYDACKARIAAKRGNANEKMLFHATSRAACGGIVQEGFDMRRSGAAHGSAYGPGAYFAVDALTSHGYTRVDGGGGRSMLLCKVVLGDMKEDSTASNEAAFNIYVVNREQQILPVYHILYLAPDEGRIMPKKIVAVKG